MIVSYVLAYVYVHVECRSSCVHVPMHAHIRMYRTMTHSARLAMVMKQKKARHVHNLGNTLDKRPPDCP